MARFVEVGGQAGRRRRSLWPHERLRALKLRLNCWICKKVARVALRRQHLIRRAAAGERACARRRSRHHLPMGSSRARAERTRRLVEVAQRGRCIRVLRAARRSSCLAVLARVIRRRLHREHSQILHVFDRLLVALLEVHSRLFGPSTCYITLLVTVRVRSLY